jgi:hypothetical protein
LNPCGLFLIRLKSILPERRTAKILPHREIWPLKITGKIRFLPINAPITPESEKLDPEKSSANSRIFHNRAGDFTE